MSDLSFIEKSQLEELLNMGGGYVLDFSNRTFHEFIVDSVQTDIYAEKYAYASGSKANRLRAFWELEPNHVVGKLLTDLLDYCRHLEPEPDEELWTRCSRIVERLRQAAQVIDVDALDTQLNERGFELLARSVKEAIDRNQPEVGLDRLHTYVLKYMRHICERHGIAAPREKPLHSLAGEYVKHMKAEGRIESEMTERILKSSISTMEAFSRVRNEQSLAHDNPILNYNESLLIFNHVASALRFIESLERESNAPQESAAADDDMPF
ncbi:MAG: abortive infection family protein [Phycisphaeraceae bacterium]